LIQNFNVNGSQQTIIDQTVPGVTNGIQINAALPAGDNNVGNVDIVTLPSGNLGQQAKTASLSIAPASDITDATYIGDIKFGEALPAGTNLLGKFGIDQTTDGTTNRVVSKISQTVGENVVAIDNLDIALTALRDAIVKTGLTSTTLTDLAIILGEVSATPTSNTLSARLKDLLTGIVLSTGSNIVGKVGIDQSGQGTTNGVVVKSHTDYLSDATTLTLDTDVAITPSFTVQKVMFLINEGSDILISFDTATETVGKSILLKNGEGIDNLPLVFSVVNARLSVAGGSAVLRYMFIG